MKKRCVGIDIGKLTFSAAIKIKDKDKVKSFSNQEEGFKKFLEWLQKNSVEGYHCCMESTGKYGDKLALFLHNNLCVVSIVNPAKIKYFMKSQLARNKTDPLDAKFILKYCEMFKPEAWQPALPEVQELQELVRRLDALIKMELQEQNRLENVAKIIKESINEHIEYLKKEMKKVEEKIKNHIDQYPRFKEQSVLLSSIPGIGDKTIGKVFAFLKNIEEFSNAKKVGAFIGLNPQQSQSGTSLNYTHLSKTGNAELRKAFYMPALVAIRYNPIIKAFYEKLIGKGKPKKVAICAAMRKLVHIIFGVLTSKKPFNPQQA